MYNDNKYTKWYYQIIDNAKSEYRIKLPRIDKSFIYYEKHHIVPKSLGGIEVVLLTAKEHFICHLLLPKMLNGEEKYKMIAALVKMTFSKSKGQYRYTAKAFNVVRAFIAEKNSYYFKGKPKSPETIAKMKGVNGKWIRSADDRTRMSEWSKTRVGSLNGFYGKSHTKESMDKRTDIRRSRGIKPVFTGKGTKWYTNGIQDKMCYPDDIPEGFILGRSKNRKGNNHGMAAKEQA